MSRDDVVIIRASSLSSYPDCNRRGAARMFRREIQAAGFRLRETVRGIGASIGSAVHSAARVTLAEKARSGALPPEGAAADWAEEQLRADIADGVVYDGPKGATQNRDIALRQTVAMTRAYHRVVAPTVNPIMVEERLEAEVAPGLLLSGQPDIVAREPGGIRDLKTSARAHPGYHAPQVGAYSLLARSHHVIEIQTAGLDFIQRPTAKKPQADPKSIAVPVGPAETAASNILRHIERDLKVFREGDHERRISPGDPWAFQSNPSSNLCSERWCPCWGVTGHHSFCGDWSEKEDNDR